MEEAGKFLNEHKLRLQAEILSSIRDTVLVVSREMKTIWANAAAIEIFGDRPEMFTEPCYRFYKRRSEICEECPVTRTFADGGTHQWVSSSYDKDGNLIWRLIRAYPYHNEVGELCGAIEVVSDYSERKAIEDLIGCERDLAANWSHATTFSERLRICLRTALQISRTDCGGIYLKDETDGSLSLLVHQGLPDDFVEKVKYYPAGSDRARLVEQAMPVYQPYIELFIEADGPAVRDVIRAVAIIPVVFQNRVVGCLNVASFTFNQIPEHARLSLERIAAYAGSFIVQEMQEEKNRRNLENLETLFNTLEEMLFILDMKGTILWHNSTVTGKLGFGRDELIGRHVLSVHPEHFHEAAKGVIADIVAGKTDICMIPLQTKSGMTIPVETKVKSGRWKDQDAMIGISRDISERIRLESERFGLERRLHQLEKSKSLNRMAGAVAHHFNNMLAVVLGNLELIREYPRDQAIPAKLREAEKAALRAAEMSRFMLIFLGQSPGKPEFLDLSACCRESLDQLKDRLPPGGVLHTGLPEPGPVISSDPSHLRQVIACLFTNAVEAIPGGLGRVSVSAGRIEAVDIEKDHRFPMEWEPGRDAYAYLMVEDNGKGLDGESLGRIFDPFYTDKPFRAGLGLAMTLGMVRSLGGCVTVESRRGHGSRFRAVWPLSQGPVRTREKADTYGAEIPLTGGRTALVVEDEELVLKVVKAMLDRFGFNVLSARDGIEAEAVFRRLADEIGLVICDLTMPRRGGWETLDVLRRIRPRIPVILASGYDEAQAMAGDHGEKPTAFLQKPFEMNLLKATLQRIGFRDGSS